MDKKLKIHIQYVEDDIKKPTILSGGMFKAKCTSTDHGFTIADGVVMMVFTGVNQVMFFAVNKDGLLRYFDKPMITNHAHEVCLSDIEKFFTEEAAYCVTYSLSMLPAGTTVTFTEN